MGNPLKAEKIDDEISQRLDKELEKSALSLRRLSGDSGVKLTRLGDVLRRGKPMTTGELNSIAQALNLEGWRIFKDAKNALASAESVVAEQNSENANSPETIPEHATQAYIDEAQRLAREAIANGYALAAKHHEPNPYDRIGEESQAPTEDEG